MEIERKFVPEKLPAGLFSRPHKELTQGYLCTDPVVRIRREDNRYYMTYKSSGLMAREEYNLPLTEKAFSELLPKCDGRIIEKTRYLLPVEKYPSLTAELDLFHGELNGLIILEVEFPSEKDALSFSPPSWFGKDVTNDKRYHNSSLSSGGEIPHE